MCFSTVVLRRFKFVYGFLHDASRYFSEPLRPLSEPRDVIKTQAHRGLTAAAERTRLRPSLRVSHLPNLRFRDEPSAT